MMRRIKNQEIYEKLVRKLSSDCEKCSGLCCVGLYFSQSEGFPKDKPPGKPCEHLREDFRCGIHASLLKHKLKGCMAYECFGAGQLVTQVTYQGDNWRNNPDLAEEIYAVFLRVRQLHQILWYLLESSMIAIKASLAEEIDALIEENEALIQGTTESLLSLDLMDYQQRANLVIRNADNGVRRETKKSLGKKQCQDFIGKNFKKANLDDQDFSLAWLMAANLEGCSLKRVNFLGADLRDAKLKNTDLRDCLFLTQGQINSAWGNAQTLLPKMLNKPLSWKD